MTEKIDIHFKATELLELLANSVYDRDTSNPNPLYFSIKEIHIVERWLREILQITENKEKSALIDFLNNLESKGKPVY